MATVNIPSTCNDPQYRYKMPRLVSKKEGRGNGSKTCIVNMGDVARAIKRPPQYTTKWFGHELGAQSTYTCKEGEGERSIVNGHHDTPIFQELLDKFIAKYVLCTNCHLPEIDMFIKKGNIVAKCMACGWAGDLDNAHRLAAFIVKNPPDDSGLNIISQAEAAAGKLDKKARREMKAAKMKEKKDKGGSDDENDKDDEDDDDDDSEAPAKKKKEKKEKKEGEEGTEKKDKKEKKEKKRRKKEQELQRQSGGKAEAGEERGPGRPVAEGEREGGLERSGSGSLRQSRVSEVTADGRKIVRYKRKRRPGEKKGEHKGRRRGEASRSRSAKKAELVDDESDGPIDLDEVEVVQGTELVVMGGPSSSSSSSSSDDAQAVRGRKGPIELDLDGVVSLDAEAQVPARAKAPAEDARSEASGESMC